MHASIEIVKRKPRCNTTLMLFRKCSNRLDNIAFEVKTMYTYVFECFLARGCVLNLIIFNLNINIALNIFVVICFV